jgi:hypothetical protein
LGRCGCPLRFRALARNCGLSVGRFTGTAGHQRSSWSDCRSWVVTCEDTHTSLCTDWQRHCRIARGARAPQSPLDRDDADTFSFTRGRGDAELRSARSREWGVRMGNIRPPGEAVRRPIDVRGTYGESEGGRGAGDLRERPRRRASERSERASLAAPPERPLSPKSRPLPTHRHRCRSQLPGDQLEKKGRFA